MKVGDRVVGALCGKNGCNIIGGCHSAENKNEDDRFAGKVIDDYSDSPGRPFVRVYITNGPEWMAGSEWTIAENRLEYAD